MPLIKSGSKEAVSQNIKEMMAAGHPQKQAVAAALSNQRRYRGMAYGGNPMQVPWYVRSEARGLHSGLYHSDVPGRTDKINSTVKGSSFVFPADVVSALGQGNTLAGAKVLDQKFKQGPAGTAGAKISARPFRMSKMMSMSPAKVPKGMVAKGGHAPTNIVAAGGEYVLEPEHVTRYGDGDHEEGHRRLRKFVEDTRAKYARKLRKLPGPKK